MWYGGCHPDILKTVAALISERALELYSLKDDIELRKVFEPVGGIKTGIRFFTWLNGQVDACRQIFQSIDTNFVHRNYIESVQVDFKGNDVYFKTYSK